MKHASLIVLVLFLTSPAATVAQNRVQANADALYEKLISADLVDGVKQQAVLTTRTGVTDQRTLVVLLPGTPGVLRPEVVDGKMVSSKLQGNPLIRARRLMLDDTIALLAVDCRSDSGNTCSESYQSSPQREQDIQKVVALAKKEIPTINAVWLVGHSAGTLAAAFMAKYNQSAYAGIIHAATISDPYKKGSFRSLGGFDYGAIKIPQVFIHHKDDPCFATTYDSVESIAKKFGLPLITVYGGGDFQGRPCEPYTQHGFRGMEGKVMREIAKIVRTGSSVSGEIR